MAMAESTGTHASAGAAPPDQTLDTIVAISTPPGRGGIGIVRLSGPAAIATAGRLLRLTARLDATQTHAVARRAQVLDPGNPGSPGTPPPSIDEAIVTVFRAPHSYTGDDLVEIAAHGSPVVLQAIVAAALAAGAGQTTTAEASSADNPAAGSVRLAHPGEFTQRAFLSGRLDLTQAEAVHDLIAAQTIDQARVAAQQLGGALSRRVAPAKEALLHLIALLEAGMDFASGELDDVDIVPTAEITARIAAAQTPLGALAASFDRGQILRNGAAIAIVGPANAGKSSMFNRLLDRERAIVTPFAGTTRDTVEETLALGGIPLRLIDTAGLRDLAPTPTHTPSGAGPISFPPDAAAAPPPLDLAEQQGIARSKEALADADLVLLVHDATEPFSPAEQSLADSLTGRPHLLVANKIDLLSGETEAYRPGLPAAMISTSALTGHGLDQLREAILRQLNAEGALAAAGALNNLRQQEAVRATLASLTAAATANTAGLPHELLLMDLHSALDALDSLTGATTPDDILGRIFSTFCIGK
jgi:tRNA modification GTPase